MHLDKSNSSTDNFAPLERAQLHQLPATAKTLRVSDSKAWVYVDSTIVGESITFAVRGALGWHRGVLLDGDGNILESFAFTVKTQTALSCPQSPYEKLANTLSRELLMDLSERKPFIIDGKVHRILVCWSRDHVYTLNMARHFMEDVTSGTELWLDTQRDDGRFWDCLHHNPEGSPTWFGEALGENNFTYFDHNHIIARRIPVEADVEYMIAEAVYYAYKATGDLRWLEQQLPKLEKALQFNTTDPIHWSSSRQLVRRSFCMDSWDFVNPYFCQGDHRCYHEGDRQFLLHSDNSGLYAFYWRLAEMYKALGRPERAEELLSSAEDLRKRANEALFFETNYGHMIPEDGDPEEVYALVGDERKRMSLSTGYSINRGMATHEMAVAILDEYRRRKATNEHESFAEWWTMDPPYQPEQWPNHGPQIGEYVNGGICHIISGELAKAALEHGREEYGVDILNRVWDLTVRDNENLHSVYKRRPYPQTTRSYTLNHLDISSLANRGIEYGAHDNVIAWTNEGENDLRTLPSGILSYKAINFNVIDPQNNHGRSIVAMGYGHPDLKQQVSIETPAICGKTLFLLHGLGGSIPRGNTAVTVWVEYENGKRQAFPIKMGFEINSWWGPVSKSNRGVVHINQEICRVAWRGSNPTWKNVGLYATGLTLSCTDSNIRTVSVECSDEAIMGKNLYLLAGATVSDGPLEFEENIHSTGLPACWANASLFHALYEGLGGVQDLGNAYSEAMISPRWYFADIEDAQATLHYPASDGYCTCHYSYDHVQRLMRLSISGSMSRIRLHLPIPSDLSVLKVCLGDQNLAWKLNIIENSNYLDAECESPKDDVLIYFK